MALNDYISFFSDIKLKIREAQIKATLSANAQMIQMYWDIGKMISEKQKVEGWGKNVIAKLSQDLKKEMPEVKGFSERNLKNMLRFANEYAIVQQAVAQLQSTSKQDVIYPQLPFVKLANSKDAFSSVVVTNINDWQIILSIPWGHNIILIEKIKELDTRFWYIKQTVENGWSRDVLTSMIKSKLHDRNRSVTNNFDAKLFNFQSELVKQTLKDPYIFDFLTLTEPFLERELEVELTKHIQNFLLELGTGFAFVGRQFHLQVGDKDYYIDLLFYHLKMRCFVVIDLKKGAFKPEYAGKINFYCSVIDDLLKHNLDEPTIGLILCENKNKIIAEYALKGMQKPIGISEYELNKTLPEHLKSALPSIEEIENELNNKY
jgi:predicted nuclease of restriction endonuclease-like (RecB) superfamily